MSISDFSLYYGKGLRTNPVITFTSISAKFVVYDGWAMRHVSLDSSERSVMTSYELKIYSLIQNINVDLFSPSNKEQFQISVKPFKTNKKYQ